MGDYRRTRDDLLRAVEELKAGCDELECAALMASEDSHVQLRVVRRLASRVKQTVRALQSGMDRAPDLTKIETDRVVFPGKPPTGLKGVGPLRLLLAEDNRINQFFLKDYFQAMGHAVDIAENGLVVLDMLKMQSYDLILMDIQMPFMDGLEATRSIRQALGQPWADIPIVALTAYALRHDRDKVMAAGMDAYVPKPINFGELERQIILALSARGRLEAQARPEPARPAAHAPASMAGKSEIIKRMFLAEVPKRLEAMGAFLEAGDLEGLSAESHGLRNGAHFAGATDIYALATELEKEARLDQREKALETAGLLLIELEAYLRRERPN